MSAMMVDVEVLVVGVLFLLTSPQGCAFVPAQRSSPCSIALSTPSLAPLGMATGGATTSTTPDNNNNKKKKNGSSSSSSDMAAARRYVAAGMEAFRQGRVLDSIAWFDQAQAAAPQVDPYLWQRGLSYYYADDFAAASAQFHRDVAVNPVDVEEIVWDMASQVRGGTARVPLRLVTTTMELPRGQSDRRPIMRIVYQLFRGQATEQDLAMAGHHARAMASDEFYALFYLGLYCEMNQDPTKAAHYLRRAVHTDYATSTTGRRDYMTDVARVHCQLRGWT